MLVKLGNVCASCLVAAQKNSAQLINYSESKYWQNRKHAFWTASFLCLAESLLQSQSELYHVSWWYGTLVIDLIGSVAMLLVFCQLSCTMLSQLQENHWTTENWLTLNNCLTVSIDGLNCTNDIISLHSQTTDRSPITLALIRPISSIARV